MRPRSLLSQSVLVFSQDGSRRDIEAIIASIDFAPVIHLRHTPPYLGIPSLIYRTDAPTASNVHFLLRFAFEHIRVEGAIVLESDIELGVDGFDFFRWALAAVGADAALRSSVFTVNGYYSASAPTNDLHTFTTDEFGFMVWGWLCPAWSWPEISAGWTWFANWDITLEESVRRPSGKVSLSPLVSRSRHIGMEGINFNAQDPAEIAKWEGLYLTTQPTSFVGRTPVVLPRLPTGGPAGDGQPGVPSA